MENKHARMKTMARQAQRDADRYGVVTESLLGIDILKTSEAKKNAREFSDVKLSVYVGGHHLECLAKEIGDDIMTGFWQTIDTTEKRLKEEEKRISASWGLEVKPADDVGGLE